MRYNPTDEVIPQDRREGLNKKILELIETEDLQEITKEDIYNAYTGDGGLHGLERKDFKNHHEFSQAKKEIENGQFFTPPFVCEQIFKILNPSNTETLCDPTCGKGDFFNYFNPSNCFGADIDTKAIKVAKFLYPEATIIHRDILGYGLETKVDYVIGNPPFNLTWYKNGASVKSQNYFFKKSAELLKLGGIIACVVPESFMKDSFSDKGTIEQVNEEFSFVGQYLLSADTFKSIGVKNYGTKVMVFQRRSDNIDFAEYDHSFTTIEELIEKVKNIQNVRKSMAVKLRTEMLERYDSNFVYKVNKYLYEIKTHQNLKDYVVNSLAYVEKFNTQKKPDNMEYAEWEKLHKITEKMVLSYLKRTVAKQEKRTPIDKVELVKTNYTFKLKAYSPKEHRKLHAPANSLNIKSIHIRELVLGISKLEDLGVYVKRGYRKLIEKKIREHKVQTAVYETMGRDPEIDKELRRFVFRNGLGKRSKFNDIQIHDLGLALQKQHAILNWQMGCVDSETEYLTPTGWKKISEYSKGDLVSQFNKDTESLEFILPNDYIKLPCDKMLYFNHRTGLDQMLSEEHRVLFKNKSGKQWGVKTAKEIYETTLKNKNGIHGVRLPTQFNYSGRIGLPITEVDLRLQIALMADGNFRGKKVVISLKKERKISRLRNLLIQSERGFTETYSSGYTRFRFTPPIQTKVFDKGFWFLNREQMLIIEDEVFNWDGSISDRGDRAYFTTIKENADFIQFVLASLGSTVSIYTDIREEKSITYTIKPRLVDSGLLSITGTSITEVKATDGYKYCFSVPTGFLILRRNNKIFVTGNSGKTPAGFYWTTCTDTKYTFIVSTSLSINNTWRKFLKAHDVPFVILDNYEALSQIKEGTYVLLSFHYIKKYKRQLQNIIKDCSNNISLLFDESDEITNHSSGTTKNVLALFRKAKRKLLTTGTTTRNNIAEIYSQFELLFNNGYNFVNFCEYEYYEKKDSETGEVKIVRHDNPNYLESFKARGGNSQFKRCFNPSKTTVFGKQKQNQSLYNEEQIKNLIGSTILTRKFKEVAGDKYDVECLTIKQHQGEKEIYRKIIKEFGSIVNLFYESTGNSRKDSLLQIIRQIQLLIKATSMPQLFPDYSGGESNKTLEIIKICGDSPEAKIAIGCTGLEAVDHYVETLQNEFPDRPIFEITGGDSVKKRGGITGKFEDTTNGILVCTQQSLKSSLNIPSCNRVIIESLQWNIPKIEQFYFRFIRYDSLERTLVTFLNYENTIEINLLALLMAKERLNDFVKTKEYKEESEVFDEFGIDIDLLEQLITKEKDENGKLKISWGE